MWKNLGNVVDCLQLFVAEIRKGSGRRRSGDCGSEGTGGDDSLIGVRSLWHWALVGVKLDRLGNSFGTGFGDVDAVATIVFAGISNVPAVDGMRGPSATLSGGLEDQDLGAWVCEWGAVEIKGTVQLVLRGEAWVDTGCLEKVEGQG